MSQTQTEGLIRQLGSSLTLFHVEQHCLSCYNTVHPMITLFILLIAFLKVEFKQKLV